MYQKKNERDTKKGTGGSGQSFWAERETLNGLFYSSFDVDEVLAVEQIQEKKKKIEYSWPT